MNKVLVTAEDLRRSCKAFQEHNPRDAMYKVAQELIEQRWGNAEATADALGVLLLTRNQAAYRYGAFDFGRLQRFLEDQAQVINESRALRLEALPTLDVPEITQLFNALLDALATASERRSSIGAGKALHLLAPRMFPLWYNKIARHYGCGFMGAPGSAGKYVRFMEQIQQVMSARSAEQPLEELEAQLAQKARFAKPILKFIDEYNYARFTYRWIA